MRGAALIGPSASTGPTYAEFQAHIATLATGGSKSWTGDFTSMAASTGYRTTAAAGNGPDMYGTSWLGLFWRMSGVSRVIQHALPSGVVNTAQRAAGYEIYFKTGNTVEPFDVTGIDRNGYESLSGEGEGARHLLREVIYWDGEAAWFIDPYAAPDPTPYTF